MTITNELQFQVRVLPNVPLSELLRRYRHIEALGFDLAGVADHFVDWSSPPSPWFEAWTDLAAIARETSHVRLTTWVTQIPPRNPALLAHQAPMFESIAREVIPQLRVKHAAGVRH